MDSIATAAPDEAAPDLRMRARIMIGLVVLLILVGGIVALESKALQVLVVISESMEPTLKIGDRLLVDAGAYFGRGTIVVLQDPEKPDDPEEQMVKRVIGIEGDLVEMKGGILYVNGEEQYSSDVTTNRIDWKNIRVKVPQGHVFVMGDNRENSYDSLNFGPVHESLLRGALSVIVWPPARWGRVKSRAD